MSKNWDSNRRSFGDIEGARSPSPTAIDEKIDRREIRKRFRALVANFSKRVSPDLELLWVDKLEPFAGQKLYAALDKALEEERMPTLWRVLEMFRGRRDTEQFKAPPLPTEQERRKADHAEIMSMLWLRYNHGHDSLGFIALKRLFPGDANKALTAAQEIYPREVVNRWMQDQVAAGN